MAEDKVYVQGGGWWKGATEPRTQLVQWQMVMGPGPKCLTWGREMKLFFFFLRQDLVQTGLELDL
jgi:hypothetical protein